MDPNTYHDDTSRISNSGIGLILESPLKYHDRYLSGKSREDEKKTESKVFGDMAHCLILEYGIFKQRFVVLPPNAPQYPSVKQWDAKNPNENSKRAMTWWRAFEEANKAKTVVGNSDYELALQMRQVLMDHPIAGYYLRLEGKFEALNLWQCPQTGVLCKNKFDKVLPGHDIILDYKTAKSAEAREFGRHCINYGYDRQGAFYSDGYRYGMGNGKMPAFIFIVQEKEPPFAVACYSLNQSAYLRGRSEYLNGLHIYADCRSSGVWPGYNSDKLVPLQLPGWAVQDF